MVGLYLNPPESAVVLSVDEKSQVQALAGSQPAFPMMPGMPEKRTHDYLRHGTTTLFAALNTADGSVISSLHRKHRAIEFRKFLAKIDAQVPEGLDVHLICDNYQTHKTPAVKTWLQNHPRVPRSFHSDLLIVAEPGRAVLRLRHRGSAPSQRPSQRPGARVRHPQMGQ
ncbi:hypothetical protein J2808_001636 [Pseudarthrobacter sulfonivorans]|nr:hypothetical protein [Pseudarthrobacter sulfonivorans]